MVAAYSAVHRLQRRLTRPTSSPRYTGIAIALHWLLALAILGSFVVGLYMTGLSMSPQRLKLYNWHKWAGIVILTLSAILEGARCAPPRDAGGDGGSVRPSEPGSGCACTTGRRRHPGQAGWLAMLLGPLALRRRRHGAVQR